MDHASLKKHLLSQILRHPDGIAQDQLVEKTTVAAGVSRDEHRGNILDWIDFLVTTGHVRRHGDSITAEQAARLEFQNHLDNVLNNPTMNPRLNEWLLH